MDELARRLGLDPLELRERNIIGPGEHMEGPLGEEEDLHIASYGLDQCLNVVRATPSPGTPAPNSPPRAGWWARASPWPPSPVARPAATSPTPR
ncbi:hypothetical protein GCM10020229_36010 [Kitasatospora albolonga]